MTTTAELIILHTTKYGENSLILHTLSEEYGRRSFLVRGVGGKKSMSLFLPLNVLEAEISESRLSSLFSVKHAVSKYPLFGIRNNLYKNSIALFISEVLFRVLKEGAKEGEMKDWCERSILLLDAMETDFSNFHVRFLLEFATMLGFSPEVSDIEHFAGNLVPFVERFMHSSFEESMLIPLSGAIRNELAEALLRYIEFHCESPVNVNSLKVLREVLG